jgi:hypothetical protein
MILNSFNKVSNTLEIVILYLNCSAKYAVLTLRKFTEKAIYSTVEADSATLNISSVSLASGACDLSSHSGPPTQESLS